MNEIMIQIMDVLHEDFVIAGSKRRNGIGVNTYLCVADHLKCMLMR